jgi:hypothetical protein
MKILLSTLLLFSVFICDAQKKGDNWTTLFNGKDLTGFKQLNGKAKYSVENGEIVGRTVFGEPNSFLATEKLYGDFVLELDLKMFTDMNSGIQFRSITSNEGANNKVPDRVRGYQSEVDPSDRAWSGGIYDEARRGWLYPMDYNSAAQKAFKKTDWNHYKIECIGNTIRTWINGVACAYLIDDLTPKGFIALQVHAIKNKADEGKEIHWKNIKIKTTNLKPSPSDNIFVVNLLNNTVSDEEKKQGYSLLWDGKSSAGWQSANMSPFPAQGWDIANGELSIRNSGNEARVDGGDIITEKEFGAFDFQFEFKLTDTANSGIKYFIVPSKDKKAGVGPEFQILDDAKHPDAKMGVGGNRTMASLYDLIPAATGLDPNANRRDRIAIGEWNRGRIIAHPNGTIEHWLNGFKMVEYQRGSSSFNALVAKSKYAKIENFGMAPKGRILIQDHNDKVSFRSLKIKEL